MHSFFFVARLRRTLFPFFMGEMPRVSNWVYGLLWLVPVSVLPFLPTYIEISAGIVSSVFALEVQ